MAQSKLIVLRGNDPVAIKDALLGLKKGLGATAFSDLNISTRDDNNLNFADLQSLALAIPFLSDRRLVIIERARSLLSKSELCTKFEDLFLELPESTTLVFVIEDSCSKKRGALVWENEKSYSWLTRFVLEHGSIARLINCVLPEEEDMPAWILRKAKLMEGNLRPDGARLLASYVGNDTLRAEQELDKLISYVGVQGIIGPNEVLLLTAREQEGNVFAFTDALGERNRSKAMQQFLLLTENNDVFEISGMIYRQFRLLIRTREVLDRAGREADVEQKLQLPSFVARKLYDQAQRFNMSQLIKIYQRLLEIDEGMKSGGMAGNIAYTILIAELTR